MSEQTQENEGTKKVYPGNLQRYADLRRRREELETAPPVEGQGNGNAELLIAAATIAEELAGLAYILDGIRFAARSKNG